MFSSYVLTGLMIPFAGTALGGTCVYFMKRKMNSEVHKALTGFAAGVMVAASVWSLLIPSTEFSEGAGRFAFVPAVIGFWLGILLLFVIDNIVPHFHFVTGHTEGPSIRMKRTSMMVMAVVLHNIPEGMAVGVVYAGFISGDPKITIGSALALSVGIAIQNFPEGAIISMPLYSAGQKRGKAFLNSVLSGAVEPAAGILTIIAATKVIAALPYLLSIAAGAMMYVVVEELIPEMAEGRHSHAGVIMFAAGFTLMMALDVALV